MPILPDIDDFTADYGGPFADYGPVEDPSTDQSSSQGNKLMASAAGGTRTATRAFVAFQGLTYTSGTQAITTVSHDAVWGNSISVAPVITQTSAGVYPIAWPTTVTDVLGNSHTVNIRLGWATFDGSTAQITYTFTRTGANTGTLRTWVAAAASSLNGINVGVFLL